MRIILNQNNKEKNIRAAILQEEKIKKSINLILEEQRDALFWLFFFWNDSIIVRRMPIYVLGIKFG